MTITKRYKVYTGPIGVSAVARLCDLLPGTSVVCVGTEHVYLDSTLGQAGLLLAMREESKLRAYAITGRLGVQCISLPT
jgi:hypothetical protein